MIAETQFNRSTLDCMTLLRRRLKQTQGISIRLSQPDAAEQLIQHATESTHADIQALGQRLARLLVPVAAPSPTPALAQGAIAARTWQADRDPGYREDDKPASQTGSLRIYRGRVIQD